MGPHWCYIAYIENLILSIKSVTLVEINISIIGVLPNEDRFSRFARSFIIIRLARSLLQRVALFYVESNGILGNFLRQLMNNCI